MQRTPGDLLVHPAAIAALLVVIVNDRVLKVDYPSELSGKLSDFGGLIYFPLFVVAAIESVRWLFSRESWALTSRAVEITSAVVGGAFIAIKLWSPAGEVYRYGIGLAFWPFEVVGALLRGEGIPDVYRVNLTPDPTDLVALVSLAVPIAIARSVMDRSADHLIAKNR